MFEIQSCNGDLNGYDEIRAKISPPSGTIFVYINNTRNSSKYFCQEAL